jgi:ribulose-phosphate 3-epimerase
MDGAFVPSMSVPVESAFGFNVGGSALEAHLMVTNPETHFGFLARAHYQMVIFHIEAVSDPSVTVETARGLGLSVGVAINPDTPLSALDPVRDRVDEILFMTVYPGYYGRPIVWEAVERAATFKRDYPETVVAIDGGVKAENFPLILDAGFDRVCIGSAILKAHDPQGAYETFVRMAAEYA